MAIAKGNKELVQVLLSSPKVEKTLPSILRLLIFK